MSRISPGKPSGSVLASFFGVVKDILTHSHFKHCGESRGRFVSHTLTFYGFVGLFITTCGVVVSYYGFHYYPLELFHPLKILGNLSTIALATGVILIVGDRNAKANTSETSTARDWNFISIVAAVTITGIATEVLRFANIAALAYPVYYVHLVVVFALLIYLPYSRFAHMVYRTVALVHAKHTGRDLARG
jgi:quinone-modifying oxidoreductase subunit QmoC